MENLRKKNGSRLGVSCFLNEKWLCNFFQMPGTKRNIEREYIISLSKKYIERKVLEKSALSGN